MAHITYKVVRHEDGWAYTVNGAFSESFPSHAEALEAARRGGGGGGRGASRDRPKASSTRTRAANGTANSRAATTGPRPTSRTARNTPDSVIDRQSPPRKSLWRTFCHRAAALFT